MMRRFAKSCYGLVQAWEMWVAAKDRSILSVSLILRGALQVTQEDLLESASHAIRGTVKRTYESNEVHSDFEFTYGVAEIAVGHVDKGLDIAANDTVYVRYWGKRWTGTGANFRLPHGSGLTVVDYAVRQGRRDPVAVFRSRPTPQGRWRISSKDWVL